MPTPDPLQLNALALVRAWLRDPAVARRYAVSAADFTRTRALGFPPSPPSSLPPAATP